MGMLATFRPSRHVKMIRRVANMSFRVRVVVVEFRQRHDRQAALPQKTARRKCNKEVANFLVTCCGEVSDLSGV